MHVFWELEQAFVKEVVAKMPEPKPHYNSVSTMVRILAQKGFLSHESFGKTHRYFPIVSKQDYQQTVMNDVISKYFDNSYSKMVTAFVKEEKINEQELQQILELIQTPKK